MVAPSSKLVPPGIVRKFDAALPGIDESLLELESISLPRFQSGFPPQRLTMTLLGDFWAGRTEPLPSAAFVDLLGAFAINESGARVALSRLAARGALTMERRGRTTWYAQSPHLLALLPQGRAVTAGFGQPRRGWNGTWTVVTWSVAGGAAAATQRLRTTLRELGFAPLAPGVWVSPDAPDDDLGRAFERVPSCRFTVVRGADVGVAGAEPPASAWDLAPMRDAYRTFVRTFRPVLRQTATLGSRPRDALVARTRAVYRWFVIATLDPDLPEELLPSPWPRAAAHELFVALVDELTPVAATHVRAVVAAHAPELTGLVTVPAPYGAGDDRVADRLHPGAPPETLDPAKSERRTRRT
jgi:phenylacetic acid degradation operon negative regulatory protein